MVTKFSDNRLRIDWLDTEKLTFILDHPLLSDRLETPPIELFEELITFHKIVYVFCNLGYERVYLPLCKVADTPFHIQGDDIKYVG